MHISTLLSLIFFPLHMAFFSFLEIIISRISPFIVYGNLNRFCILLSCDYCISLNYIELVHSAFQVYYILLNISTISTSQFSSAQSLSCVRIFVTP